MHNWSLLLLACLAIFEPIASFSERNLVHGREQCTERRDHHILRDTRLSLYGDAVKKERLLNFHETRDIRHHEVREGGIPRERTILESRARDTRFTREEQHRARDSQRFLTSDRDRRFTKLESRDRNRESNSERIRNNRDVRYERSARKSLSSEERMSRMLDDARRSRSLEQYQTCSDRGRQDLSVLKGERKSVAVFGRTSRDESRMSEMTRRGGQSRETQGFNEKRSLDRILSRDAERGYSRNYETELRSRDIRISYRRQEARDVRGEARRESRRVAEMISETRQQRDATREVRADERLTRDARTSRTDSNRVSYNSRESLDRRTEVREVNSERMNNAARSNKQGIYSATRNIRQSNSRLENDRTRDSLGRNYDYARKTTEKQSRKLEFTSDVRGSLNRESRMENRDKVERDSRFRKVEATRNIGIPNISSKRNPKDTTESVNWSYFFYTLQAIYICSILVHVYGDKGNDKKKTRSFNFWESSAKMIKVD